MVSALDRRKLIIDQIVNTINKAHKEGKQIDTHRFVELIMGETGASRRTAQEYLQSAYAKINRLEVPEVTHLGDEVNGYDRDVII